MKSERKGKRRSTDLYARGKREGVFKLSLFSQKRLPERGENL